MKRISIPLDLPSQFSLTIFWINGLLMRNGEKIAKAYGQSSARWQVLGRAEHGTHSISEMARQLGLARQSVQRVANDLKSDGLVEFAPVQGDRRSYRVELTEKGRGILQSIYGRNALWSEAIQELVTSEEFINVIPLLKSIGNKMEKELDHE